MNSGGVFDMSALTTAGMTAGSIEGAGTYNLGSKELIVGLNDLSTQVSGVTADGRRGRVQVAPAARSSRLVQEPSNGSWAPIPTAVARAATGGVLAIERTPIWEQGRLGL